MFFWWCCFFAWSLQQIMALDAAWQKTTVFSLTLLDGCFGFPCRQTVCPPTSLRHKEIPAWKPVRWEEAGLAGVNYKPSRAAAITVQFSPQQREEHRQRFRSLICLFRANESNTAHCKRANALGFAVNVWSNCTVMKRGTVMFWPSVDQCLTETFLL